MNYDEEILKINSLRFAIKMEINSTYGVNFDGKRMKNLYDKSYELLKRKNALQTQKDRIEKLKIINDKSFR